MHGLPPSHRAALTQTSTDYRVGVHVDHIFQGFHFGSVDEGYFLIIGTHNFHIINKLEQ